VRVPSATDVERWRSPMRQRVMDGVGSVIIVLLLSSVLTFVLMPCVWLVVAWLRGWAPMSDEAMLLMFWCSLATTVVFCCLVALRNITWSAEIRDGNVVFRPLLLPCRQPVSSVLSVVTSASTLSLAVDDLIPVEVKFSAGPSCRMRLFAEDAERLAIRLTNAGVGQATSVGAQSDGLLGVLKKMLVFEEEHRLPVASLFLGLMHFILALDVGQWLSGTSARSGAGGTGTFILLAGLIAIDGWLLQRARSRGLFPMRPLVFAACLLGGFLWPVLATVMTVS
jgi:hypothetical protein